MRGDETVWKVFFGILLFFRVGGMFIFVKRVRGFCFLFFFSCDLWVDIFLLGS